jgi:hypothetical protein
MLFLINFFFNFIKSFFNFIRPFFKFSFRANPRITFQELKDGFINFLNHYKVIKIKEERNNVYSEGSLEDFVIKKFNQITYLFPEISIPKRIRCIISSFSDPELEKEFANHVSRILIYFYVPYAYLIKQKIRLSILIQIKLSNTILMIILVIQVKIHKKLDSQVPMMN